MYLVDTHAICIITKLACRFINSRNFIWFYNSNSSHVTPHGVLLSMACPVSLSLSLSVSRLLPFAICFLCVCRKCCPGQQYSIKCHKIKAMRRCLLCNCEICQAIQTHTHRIRGIPGRVLILKFFWSCSLLLCIWNLIISLTDHLHLLSNNTLHKS